MMRKVLSVLMAAAAIATLGVSSPAKAVTPIGGGLAVGYTHLSNGALAYVNLGVTDYGTSLAGSIRMVAGTSYMQARPTSIKYDATNKAHMTVSFIGLWNNSKLVAGSIDVYLDNSTSKTGRFGFTMFQVSSTIGVSSAMVAEASIQALQGNTWVVTP
jgi:hypothetical protein